MATEKIVIFLRKSEAFIAEQILFRTNFLFHSRIQMEEGLEAIDATFRNFLKANNVVFTGPHLVKIDNGFAYECPSYSLRLFSNEYLKLENFRNQHPEVVGFVDSYEFSEVSKRVFLNNLINEAKEQALEIAEMDHLRLKDDYDIEELPISTEKTWRILPPQSARVNHLLQTMEGNFKISFSVLNKSKTYFPI